MNVIARWIRTVALAGASAGWLFTSACGGNVVAGGGDGGGGSSGGSGDTGAVGQGAGGSNTGGSESTTTGAAGAGAAGSTSSGTSSSSGTGGCGGGQTLCAGACADLTVDPANCGECGAVCPPQGICIGGACQCECPAGLTICGGLCQCTDLSSDPTNCGACGVQCGPGMACVSGICLCPPLLADCDNDATNGCETDLSGDVNNCGACGAVCPAVNGTPSCKQGSCQCVLSCQPGHADCNGVCADGCESNLGSDPLNCGACGVVCAAGKACINGACM